MCRSLPKKLYNEERMVNWIAQITEQDKASVKIRLREEYENPGINVGREFKKAGLEPYNWNDKLARFYDETDSFLYELIIWNLNKLKDQMRQLVAKYLKKISAEKLNILMIGDGLGFDSVFLSGKGHHVTYFELSSYQRNFARKIFHECNANIEVIDDENLIPTNTYDVVVCLDVLEHVPNPPNYVKKLASYLRNSGFLIVHEAFCWIHKSSPTHLKENRRYSGSLWLYKKNGLYLVDGEITWNPIILQKFDDISEAPSLFSIKLMLMKIFCLYEALGRFTIIPFLFADSLRRRNRQWFDS